MMRFRRTMSLLLALCLTMAVFSQKVVAAEFSENTNSDNTVSASETLPAASEDPLKQDHEEDGTLQRVQAGSVTGFQDLPETFSLFGARNSTEEALYQTILSGLQNWDQMIDIRNFRIPISDAEQTALSWWYTRVLDEHPEVFYVSGMYNYMAERGISYRDRANLPA